jgi:hypothetical protein
MAALQRRGRGSDLQRDSALGETLPPFLPAPPRSAAAAVTAIGGKVELNSFNNAVEDEVFV